jgi:hypothetical protein
MTQHRPTPPTVAQPDRDAAAAPARPAGAATGRLRAWWNAVVGVIGAAVGLAPHVLHHIGLLAGTALVAGAGGTALFGGLGLVASVPLLLRLQRRFGTWWAPAIGLAVFAVMFSLTAFVLGPAISGGGDPGPTGDQVPGGGQPSPSTDHDSHHE